MLSPYEFWLTCADLEGSIVRKSAVNYAQVCGKYAGYFPNCAEEFGKLCGILRSNVRKSSVNYAELFGVMCGKVRWTMRNCSIDGWIRPKNKETWRIRLLNEEMNCARKFGYPGLFSLSYMSKCDIILLVQENVRESSVSFQKIFSARFY